PDLRRACQLQRATRSGSGRPAASAAPETSLRVEPWDSARPSPRAREAALGVGGGTTKRVQYRSGSWAHVLRSRRDNVGQRQGQDTHFTNLESLRQHDLGAVLAFFLQQVTGPLHILP